MEFKPSGDSTAEKSRQNMLLVVLLILVAVFAYIYFFTGLLKPQEAQKPAEAPAPQVVRMPLPPREAQPGAAAPTGTTAGAPEAGKNATAPAKPEPRKVAEAPLEPKKPEPAKPAKAVPPEKKPATPEKRGAAPEAKETKTAAAKPQPAAAAKPQPATAAKPQPATAAKPQPGAAAKLQPGATAKKPAPVKENEKVAKAVVKAPAVQSGTAKKPVAKAAPGAGKGPWTVVVGSYVLEETMAADLARVRGAGLEAAVKKGGQKKTAMNRLLVGEYPTRAEAMKKLETLKQHTSDAFILDLGGKFGVYAGSYLLKERSDSEKERMAAAGIKLTVKRADVSIPTKLLTAGTFGDKKAADAAVAKLKSIGFKPSLSRM